MATLVLLTEKENVTSSRWITHAHIAVGSNTPRADGKILLSADCVTTIEINTWADMLIKELQGIKRKAADIQWHNRPRDLN
jgi:hypothetical protein